MILFGQLIKVDKWPENWITQIGLNEWLSGERIVLWLSKEITWNAWDYGRHVNDENDYDDEEDKVDIQMAGEEWKVQRNDDDDDGDNNDYLQWYQEYEDQSECSK